MKNMKKLLALALVALSVFVVALPALAATVQTNTNAVNIRSGPNTNASLIGQVAKGTTLEVLGETQGSTVPNRPGTTWLHVKVIKCAAGSKHQINGQTGYVHSGYISGYTLGTSHPQTLEEAFGTATLQEGSRGNYVVNVQRVLEWAGCQGGYKDDGIFGPDTKRVVKLYQEKYWYDFTDNSGEIAHIDGIVGPKTKQSMWKNFGEMLKRNGIK